jgi:hypothetical protein
MPASVGGMPGSGGERRETRTTGRRGEFAMGGGGGTAGQLPYAKQSMRQN